MLVARVVAKLELGGAQISLLRVARALAERGHRTRLLAGTATPAGVKLARAHGVEADVMGSGADLQWYCDPGFAAWLAPRLAGADVVHAHMLGAWWAAARAVPDDVPLVASEHNGYAWRGEAPWSAMAEVAERVDRFYAHGPGARAGAVRAGILEDLIRPGISPVVGMDARPRPGLPSPRIVFTGRFSRDKAPDVLIDAIARMTAPPPVLMLGAGALLDELRVQVAQLGLESVVRFCGWVDDPGPWVAGATVQACPSRDEAFSQTAVLAMGLGTPVVGTNVDGFPETLANGRGIMVPAEDPKALAVALERVLAGRLRPDTAAARVWARQFDAERVATVYEQTYQDLCLAAPSEPPGERGGVSFSPDRP
ncbi:MAG TPA: glycosyltransferase [Solirubrobacterales bacterium]|nr:glycosyltransferase [Solirubrobacterales bacterium]